MKIFLDIFLPRIFPRMVFLCVPHEGWRDLEKSTPRKLRGWNVPGDRFVIMRDNDSGDCQARKSHLRLLCQQAGRNDTLVRLVCQELEAWYLGDPDAMAVAFEDERLRRLKKSSRYRDPDALTNPSARLFELVPGFRKTDGARRMAVHMATENNRSTSFQVFLAGIDNLYKDGNWG